MRNLQQVCIADLGRVITGKTPSTKAPDNFGKDLMFVTPVDLKKGYILRDVERYISKKGFNTIENNTIKGVSVLVGCIGSDLGNIAITTEKCATNQQINSITSFKDIYNPFYVYYWFCLKKEYLMNIAGNTTTPIINKRDFENIMIDILPLERQNSIADILTSLDDKIELNNKINTELEALARTLYDYWFVQFDFPDETGRPYKSSGGAMVFNPTLGREIPAGWEVKNVNTIVKIGSGFPFKSDTYDEKGKYKIITIKNVLDGHIDSNSTDTVLELPSKLPSFCKLNVGDILISLTGNVGRIGIVHEDNLLLNQRVGKLLCKSTANMLYAYCLFSSAEIKGRLEQISGGSSQSNLSPIQAVDFIHAIPSNDVLQKFYNSLVATFNLQISIKQENERLATIRDFLLPMLMNGQVAV